MYDPRNSPVRIGPHWSRWASASARRPAYVAGLVCLGYHEGCPNTAQGIHGRQRVTHYLVGSVSLRDRLIAELAAVGITAVAGRGLTDVGRDKAKDGSRLVFVRGESVPPGVVVTTLRRCHNHRDRNEAGGRRGPMLDGAARLCAECRDAATARWADVRAQAK